MLVYDAENWNAAKGKKKIEIEPCHHIEVRVSSTKDVQVLGVRSSEEIPLKIGREFKLKAKARGFDAIILKGTGQTQYGFMIVHHARRDQDATSPDNPPAPPMPGANNLIAQMRQVAQQEMARNRMPVMDPEDLPFSNRYLVDDDDYDFEEELVEKARLASQQQDEAEPGGETLEPETEPQPLAAPEAPPQPGEELPVAQAAE